MGSFLSIKDGKGDQSDITVTVDEAQNTVTWMRRDNDMVFFSFAEQQIMWPDYNGFTRRADRPYMDILQGFQTVDDNGQPRLISEGATRERLGSVVVLDLKKYGVPMLAQDGLYLVPMQTLAAFFLASENLSLYFNKECLIFTSPNEFNPINLTVMSIATTVSETGGLGDLGDGKEMSEEEMRAMAEALSSLPFPEPDASVIRERMDKQLYNAREWCDIINTFFHRLSGIPDARGRIIYD